MKYTLGIDIGTSSLGLNVNELDRNNDSKNIFYTADYIFGEPVINNKGKYITKNKEKSSNQLEQRQHERQNRRKKAIYYLAKDIGIKEEDIKDIQFNEDILEIRAKAYKEKISLPKFFAVMVNISKNRGYSGRLKKEDRGLGELFAQTNEKIQEFNAKTIGELKFKLVKEQGSKILSHVKKNNVEGTFFRREQIEEEFDLILQEQLKHYSILKEKTKYPCKNDSEHNLVIYKKLKAIIFFQRPIKWDKDSIGNCNIYENEKVVSRSSILFEKYRALQLLNNLEFTDNTKIDIKDFSKGIDLLNGFKEKSVTKFLKELGYENKTLKNNGNIKDEKIKGLYTNKKLFDTFGEAWERLSLNQKESVIDFLSILSSGDEIELGDLETIYNDYIKFAHKDEKIKEFLELNKDKLSPLSEFDLPKGRATYSLKALKKFIEFFENGVVEGINEPDKTLREIEKIDEPKKTFENLNITNPIVQRAIKETIFEIDKLVKIYGEPYKINIEFTRDIKKSLKQRGEIEAKNNKRYSDKQLIKKELQKYAIKPTSKNIQRYILWQQQKHQCIYTEKTIGLSELTHYELEHIVPESKGGTRVMYNLVLADKEANKDKNNKTPYEYFHDKENWKYIQSYINHLENILKETKDLEVFIEGKNKITLDKEELKKKLKLLNSQKSAFELGKSEFGQRSYSDTSYIAKEVTQLLKDKYPNTKDIVITKGGIVAYLRSMWGLNDILPFVRDKENKPIYDKDRNKISYEDYQNAKKENLFEFDKRCDHRHHAIDAIVISFCSRSLINKLSAFHAKYGYLPRKNPKEFHKGEKELFAEVKNIFDKNSFYTKIQNIMSEIVVWHKPDRYPKGDFFDETIYGKDKEGYFTKRVKVVDFFDGITKVDKAKEKIEKWVANEETKTALLENFEKFKDEKSVKEIVLNLFNYQRKTPIKKIQIKFGKRAPQKFNEKLDKELKNGYAVNSGYSCINIDKNTFNYELIPNHKFLKVKDKNIVQLFANDIIFDKESKQFYKIVSFAQKEIIKAKNITESDNFDSLLKQDKGGRSYKFFGSTSLKNIVLVNSQPDIETIKEKYL
ncbi:type II CRISPR RNA-guided endonuclease Cas9 [Halarcobacter anaerophilus]|uniref:CRISPR-associated endonuclease Cas9 n=1 Tax=Halarcobacter anaerophilus TaxID=877500 RepID=A0A4Q0XZX1_9BACT|nr:type II CRISPR RNA-guided endonuclease Cas9 [Halarcobacter anaerophilus]QDF28547.1 CRISPR/Cas system-associated RNA-guided endonuclease Cas9, type II-C [Halarcobacter anaerophilus]RXJ63276.1 type II CRISPR RNA-guided endonuclease Cas9 [Halarcobacter anaerophilus]